MNHHITAALVAAGIALGAGQAAAATLGLTTEAPSLSSNTALIDYFEIPLEGDLSAFGSVVDFTNGVSPAGFAKIGFGIGFSLADPMTGASGGFDISDEDGIFLSGDLLALGFIKDVIELQFGNLKGSAAGLFSSSVLAMIAFDNPLGDNPFASLFEGDSRSASIVISSIADSTVPPIPLPAGLILLLTGIGGIFLLKRRRSI
jgi:hypothetical protein